MVDLTEADWPEITFVEVDVRSDPRFSGLRNLEPRFSRWPDAWWCRIFRFACEDDESLDWMGAGHVCCRPEQIPTVRDRFRQITQQANDGFRHYLSGELLSRPSEIRDLIAIEQSAAASEDGEGHLCHFSSFV